MPIRGHSQRAGRRGDGRVRDRVSRRQADQRRRTPPRSSKRYGFPIPDWPGLTATEMVEAARAASSICSTASAAISSARCPSRITSRDALANVPLRVHQDIILTDQMFIDRRAKK